MLVRKYIHQRLQEYYAQPFDKVVGSLQSLLLSRNHNYLTTNSRTSYNNNIPFRYLFGEYHWKYIYSKLYNNNSGQWLTPSELFSPYYGQCIALWIIQQIQHIQQPVVVEDENTTTGQRTMNTTKTNSKVRQRPSSSSPPPTKRIEIIELGGGRGTNAIDILDYIHEHYYDTIYQYIISYTIIDSSIPLIQYQNDNIHYNHNHTSIFHTKFLDLYTYATSTCSTNDHQSITHNNNNNNNINNNITMTSGTSATTNHHHVDNSHNNGTLFNVTDNNNHQQESDTTITIVIGLEILDNLPHDKIRVTSTKTTPNNTTTSSSNIVEQAELIQCNESQQYKEIYVPLNDPIIQNVIQYYPLPIHTNQQHKQQHYYYWIPTIACTMIHKILQERPDTLFLFADFDNFINEIPKQQHITKNSVNNNDTTASISIPVPAIGEPIVTDMNDNDLISYIIPSKTPTDILFPTNFHSLSSYIQSIQSIKYTNNKNNNIPYKATINSNSKNQTKNVQIYKQYDFLQQYGPQQVIATTSYITGYSPMIHDFENCSIITVGDSSCMDT